MRPFSDIFDLTQIWPYPVKLNLIDKITKPSITLSKPTKRISSIILKQKDLNRENYRANLFNYAYETIFSRHQV